VTSLTLVGVSHHRTPIELRERVALDLDACRALSAELGGGAVVLSTCNRTELYLEREDVAEDEAVAAVTDLAGDRGTDLAAALYRLRDDGAALHLFRVAAGLDSLVPGEGEILGQVRSAFEAGAPGPVLDRLFRQALHTGRRVRIETAIGESPASVPSAAAALAQQVFGELDARRVLLLGAGKMSEATARNLVSRGAEIAVVANRTIAHGEDLARKLGARALALDAVAAELEHVDVVVSATSAAGVVVSRETVAHALRVRKGRPLLLVDLAVPRDLDPAINGLEGCFLYDVDDLTAVVEETLSGRRGEAASAERLVAEEAERFREWHAALDVVPTIASLRALVEEIRDSELARAGGRLSETERRHVESVTSQIVAKLLHLPTIRMKEAAAAADGVVYADVVRHLFGLGEEERRR
jgi:glutamyl-tRNA reductase